MLLLDEPFDGVDPIGVEATFDVIADARARGACVLVSTHLRELAIEACTTVLVLRGGARVATRRRRRDGRRGGGACLPRPPRLTPARGRRRSAPSPTSGTCCASAPRRVRRRVGRRGSCWSSLLLTVAAAVVPAFVRSGAGQTATRHRGPLLLLPTALAGFLLLAIVSAVASGGGRELVAREQAVAFPISPTTDHLGALLLAPLNIAWLLQAWILLGSTAYRPRRPRSCCRRRSVILLWLAAATAIAQVVAWTVEARPASAARHRARSGRSLVGARSAALGAAAVGPS